MKTFYWLLLPALVLAIALGALVACGDDDDDDDNDDDDAQDYPVVLAGTMTYDGDVTAAQIMVALTDHWPMTQAPLWFGYVDIPEAGFPFTYELGVDQPFVGDYYLLALIDVDPTDGVGMNPDIDPLAIPTAATTLVEGTNGGIDFTFIDPDDIADDDDDDDDDDDTTDDDTGDDDTVETTGISGTLAYAGAATGDKVVFGFWDGLPIMAPDHTFEVEVPTGGFPFDYEIETDFTGDWKVVAFLDVDPNDGSSWNSEIDPSNWSMTIAAITIVDGQMTDYDIELIDP